MTVRILSLPFTESEIMEIVVRKSPKVYVVRVGEHRLSSYRGVIILWDEDTDARVLNAIDAMPALVRAELVFIGESQGSVEMQWKGETPEGYTGMLDVDDDEDPDCGDSWAIMEAGEISRPLP